MSFIDAFRYLLRAVFRAQAAEHAREEEFACHQSLTEQELRQSDIAADEARHAARRAFGNATYLKEEIRQMSALRWIDALREDLRLGVRTLQHSPLFALVAVLSLGLGIGACTAMFSLVNAVLLRPLPYQQPDRLVHLWEMPRGSLADEDRSRTSFPDFLDWRAERGVFAALEAYDETNVTVSDASGAAMVPGVRVTSGFFTMLGVSPALGRTFDIVDDAPGGTHAVVLSHGLWLRRFGAAADIIGRTLTIDGVPYEIRGVLPAGFNFAPVGDADVWLPIGRSAD